MEIAGISGSVIPEIQSNTCDVFIPVLNTYENLK
jgi:hypothetical protein